MEGIVQKGTRARGGLHLRTLVRSLLWCAVQEEFGGFFYCWRRLRWRC